MASPDNTSVTGRIKELVEPICTDMGLELVDVQFRREPHGQVLRVVIFSKDGINIDDCAGVSRELGYLLDVNDFIEQAYTLEVTSPGLDWPLQTARDFQRYQGREVKVTYVADDSESVRSIKGVIGRVDEAEVEIELPDDEKITVPLAAVKKAKLIISF